MPTAPPDIPAVDVLAVRPWPDTVIDAVGHDPRSAYVETFWLSVLGPSTTWLLRHLAASLESSPEGFDLDLPATARRLGLGDKGGRGSAFHRAIQRCIVFELAHLDLSGDAPALAVRRRVPPLNRRQVLRLPELLQTAHQRWQEHQLRTPPLETMRRRSRQLALSMFEIGVDPEEVELQLMRWQFHPAIASESARWAHARHVEALEAASPAPT